MTKHGITIRDKKTKELVKFIECDYGRKALIILSALRTQTDLKRFSVEEEIISDDLQEIRERGLNHNKEVREKIGKPTAEEIIKELK